MTSINNSGNYDLLSSVNNTNINNNGSLVAANSIDKLEDTLDKQFGVNITGNKNTSVNNTSVNNTSVNNLPNISMNMQDNTILSNNTSNTSNTSNTNMNNILANNMGDFEIYENGVPLAEFVNSNKNSNTNTNQNITKSPNRKLSNNTNVVNTNVKFAVPSDNINNISNNVNTTLSNNNNSNINKILKDGLLETSTNNSSTQGDLEDYYYLDDNKNENTLGFGTQTNLKDIDINKTNPDANGTKISDNFILNFPARMSDGRQFTDYKSNGFLNLHEQEVKTTLEYRLHLQNNAETIMDNNYNIVESVNNCSDCPGYQIVDTKSLLTCSKESCVQKLQNESGLGFDIKYVTA